MRHARAGTSTRPATGFTLTELLVVIAIIGILIAFILIAAQDGVRRAEERATQALIAKLEMGVSERIEAILTRRADVSFGHQYLAAVSNPKFPSITNVNDPNYLVVVDLNNYFGAGTFNNSILSPQRAQVIAQIDRFRADLPDVFFVQTGINAAYGANYPINFAGGNFPFAVGGADNYLIPLGAYSAGAPGKPASPTGTQEPGDPNQAVGIFGATFQAAGGITKNLGYLPKGYDGADNDGNGLVDEFAEGYGANPSVADPDNPSATILLKDLIIRRLGAHKHNTARSEMLYALLVEGIGPLGSVFSRDEFTNRQVADTDGDGLPEFIDSWGQPLQFFRWPIYYNNLSSTTVASGPYSSTNPPPTGFVQKGTDPYNGTWNLQPSEPRQVDPLDPNQTLTSIVWWANPPNGSGTSGVISGPASTFESLFHSLTDLNFSSATAAQKTGGMLWDRSGAYARRAYYSRVLIMSSGPDQTPGVNILPVFPRAIDTTIPLAVSYLISQENTAAPSDFIAAGDDITNQAMGSPTGGVR